MLGAQENLFKYFLFIIKISCYFSMIFMCTDDLKECIKRFLLPKETIDLILEISLLLSIFYRITNFHQENKFSDNNPLFFLFVWINNFFEILTLKLMIHLTIFSKLGITNKRQICCSLIENIVLNSCYIQYMLKCLVIIVKIQNLFIQSNEVSSSIQHNEKLSYLFFVISNQHFQNHITAIALTVEQCK